MLRCSLGPDIGAVMKRDALWGSHARESSWSNLETCAHDLGLAEARGGLWHQDAVRDALSLSVSLPLMEEINLKKRKREGERKRGKRKEIERGKETVIQCDRLRKPAWPEMGWQEAVLQE